MKRLALFLLLAPFLTACIADDNYYYASNTHYHKTPHAHAHAHAQVDNSHYHRRPAIRNPHRYQNHANNQLHGNTSNKPSTHSNSRNIPAHGHD